jgi:hypothetical protein
MLLNVKFWYFVVKDPFSHSVRRSFPPTQRVSCTTPKSRGSGGNFPRSKCCCIVWLNYYTFLPFSPTLCLSFLPSLFLSLPPSLFLSPPLSSLSLSLSSLFHSSLFLFPPISLFLSPSISVFLSVLSLHLTLSHSLTPSLNRIKQKMFQIIFFK